MLPPFTYYGGKTRIAPRIAALLPPHEHYVEPFAGSLAVLLAKTPTRFETANDLNRDLMRFWRVLRDRPADLARVCALTPHSRAEHEAAFEPTEDDLEAARRVWVRLSQGRTGRLTPTGWKYRVRGGGGASLPTYLEGYRARMDDLATRLASVSLECRPAEEVIATYGTAPGVLLYVDPPYLASVRGGKVNYAHELATEADHVALAEQLHRCRSEVVLSGYASPLYDDLFADWKREEIPTLTTNGGGPSERLEVLWIKPG